MRLLLAASLAFLCAPATAPAQSADTARRVVMQAGKPVAAPKIAHQVDSVALHLLGDSLIATPDSSAAAAAPSWDIDVRSYETRERVTHFVSLFSGRAKEHIQERLERGTRYEPMIRAKLRAGGVPEDMYYLALIESGFDPDAYSRAAAVGMWQFMTSTARDLGLRVDWWVDERRDPVRSTSAAVRFIRDLRNQFGSLYLAAAAYNGGPGRIARGMARFADDVSSAESDDPFFVLAEKDYLKHETRDYVPQLIAAALIAKEPARYGMEVRSLPAYAYDSVTVPASTPLSAVAKASASDVRTVLDLNPHFLRGMTPPRESTLVRIPVGSSAGFDSTFASLPKSDRMATHAIETKKGDTPDRVARAGNIPVSALRAFNPGAKVLKSGRYPIGSLLTVPVHEVAEAVRYVPDPAIERFGKAKKATAARHSKKHGSAPAKASGKVSKKLPAKTKKAPSRKKAPSTKHGKKH